MLKNKLIKVLSITLIIFSFNTYADSLDSKRQAYVKKLELNQKSINYDYSTFEKLKSTFNTNKEFTDYINKKELYHLIESRDEKMD